LNIHFNPRAVIPLPGITQEKRKLTPTKNKLIAGLLLTAKPGNIQVHPQVVAQSSMATGGSGDPPPPGWVEKARHRGVHALAPLKGKTQPRRQMAAPWPTRVGVPWGRGSAPILLLVLIRPYTHLSKLKSHA